jgi:hypothetical protein
MSLRVSLGAFTSARNAALVSARGDGSAMEASPARALRSVFLAYVAAARRRVADADGSRPSKQLDLGNSRNVRPSSVSPGRYIRANGGVELKGVSWS